MRQPEPGERAVHQPVAGRNAVHFPEPAAQFGQGGVRTRGHLGPDRIVKPEQLRGHVAPLRARRCFARVASCKPASRQVDGAHVSTPDRRDRLWLVNAFAVVLLTLLGAAGEALGHDRHLESNMSTRRAHALFRQGSMLYELIPTMPDHYLRPLAEQFAHMLAAQPVFREMFGAI